MKNDNPAKPRKTRTAQVSGFFTRKRSENPSSARKSLPTTANTNNQKKKK